MDIKNEFLELIVKEIFGNSAPVQHNSTETPFEVGKAYLIRTVTHIDLGEVVDVVGSFVVLKDASWIADTGRYHDCLAEAKLNEVEPYPNTCFVNLGSVCDAAPWDHDLPRIQK